jgi:hypothetical protein
MNARSCDSGSGSGSPGDGPRGGPWPDIAAILSFVVFTGWITGRLWLDPDAGVRDNRMDQAQFEWMLAHGARVVTELAYPFFSDRMNVPDGVNLMANTSVLAVSLPLTPVTLLAGPRVAFNVFLTGGLLATAVAWYLLFARYLVGNRIAAWLGAIFCAFSPGMVSHANGHPNIVSQFLVPLLIWRTLRLREAGRWLRNGCWLALVVVWQAFINLEILFMTAAALGIVIAVLALRHPELRVDWRPFLAGLGVAAGIASVLLAYPLYILFAGPQAYHGLPGAVRAYGADLASFVAYARESIAGSPAAAEPLAQNPTEENAFFGWPLVILMVALVWWLRREAVVLGLAVVGLLYALFSLGPRIRFEGRDTGIPSLWALLDELPVLHSVVPTRWALALTPIIGVLLPIGFRQVADLAAELGRVQPRAGRALRYVTATALAMALVPLLPTPLAATRIAPTPEFIASGAWRSYAEGERSVVTLPLPGAAFPDPLRWAAQTRLAMRIPRGYFLGPDEPKGPDRVRPALFGPVTRPTDGYLEEIRRTGTAPPVDDQRRAEAVADLRYWRAGVVMLTPHPHAEAFARAMTELTGITPVEVAGSLIWDVRPLTG